MAFGTEASLHIISTNQGIQSIYLRRAVSKRGSTMGWSTLITVVGDGAHAHLGRASARADDSSRTSRLLLELPM